MTQSGEKKSSKVRSLVRLISSRP